MGSEYQRETEILVADVAKAIPTRELIQGNRWTQYFFDRTQSPLGQSELKPDVELRDTPPPIHYDDEFGKATLSFSRIKTGRAIMPVFAMKYQEDRKEPVYFNEHMHSGFYFAETRGGFSTLSRLGDPVVFFNHGLLSMSRNFLLALGHEMGHTLQEQIEADLWKIIRANNSPKVATQLRRKYPHLQEYVDDLACLLKVAREEDPAKKQQLARTIQNTEIGGLNMRWLEPDFPERVEAVLETVSDAPIGYAHPAGFFNTVRANLPAVYDILDPMEERMAWEHGITLDQSTNNDGIMHCGFNTPEERTLFMRRNLETYDRHNGVDNYTRWLGDIKTTTP